jgi:molybdopterin synthase catalytic subunit
LLDTEKREDEMDLAKMIQTLKAHHDYPRMGMIASHLGVVRETSLNGGIVKGIEVQFNEDVIKEIVHDAKRLPGIIDVLVETSDGRLKVGDEIMAVVVGGDTREHVFPALIDTVDRIKKHGAKKKEFAAI